MSRAAAMSTAESPKFGGQALRIKKAVRTAEMTGREGTPRADSLSG